ncbi:MAG: efflux RND transporter periplasmic adaptor subunit [Oscillospiraceae bacterium]|nr:efflux RND transporter periplasmic adaptor subunit [Oscillospiraceae bacterium]
MKGRKNSRKIWPWILVIALIAAAVVWRMGLIPGLSPDSDSEQAVLTTAEAFLGSIEVITEGSGSVEAASSRSVRIQYKGKLNEILIEEGDQVSDGQVLAEYDRKSLDTLIEEKEAELEELNNSISRQGRGGTASVTSPVSGRVKRIFAEEDDSVSEIVERFGGLMEISADGKLKVSFPLPEKNASSLMPGGEVRVEVEGHTKKGVISFVKEGVVTVTIEDDGKYDLEEEAIVFSRTGERLGSGILTSNYPYLVRFEYGIVESVQVEENESVYSGTVLFHLRDVTYNREYLNLLKDRQELVDELTELRAFQKDPVIRSPFSGYVKKLDISEETDVDEDEQLCTIADLSELKLKVEIDELEIDRVEIGQPARIVFDAFEEESYEGTVEKISGAGNNSGGVTDYLVTISLKGDNRLKDAMSATAFIRVAEKENALLVPVDAVESDGNEKFVQVMQNGTAEKRVVQIGLINNRYAEITDGLSARETVVVSGLQNDLQLPIYTSGNRSWFGSRRS